ncbi:hypothetical protein [Streptomyces sp. NPDC007007]|uniref:hypothetical protein n=1 Tax=Streptomyces sp. NPDC007007 TaxID=3364770 RepID=UPI0036B91D61
MGPRPITSAPADLVAPAPHAEHLARCVRGPRLVEIPVMGHAVRHQVHAPLAAAILDRTGRS